MKGVVALLFIKIKDPHMFNRRYAVTMHHHCYTAYKNKWTRNDDEHKFILNISHTVVHCLVSQKVSAGLHGLAVDKSVEAL